MSFVAQGATAAALADGDPEAFGEDESLANTKREIGPRQFAARLALAATILLPALAFAGANTIAAPSATSRRAAAPSSRAAVHAAPPQAAAANGGWRFAVSGDSRNCGDVVMPAIAAGAQRDSAQFYWHLGDFRAIYTFDEDILHQQERLKQPPLSILDYETLAWRDFIDHQLTPFGNLPVFLALGNHETIAPKSRQQVLTQFADWLNAPAIAQQRLRDDPYDHMLRAYYHWVERNVSFYTLDNSTADQFDLAQLGWLESLLAKDATNSAISTIVVGMHEALPDSLGANHAMDDFPAGTESGQRVYADLLKFQGRSHKRVYVLASHSHFYMEGIFNTPYWRSHGGVLPGWIVGTAGAVRYPLPPDHRAAGAAQTNVYGYLLASVAPSGEIRFDFKRFAENDLKAAAPAGLYDADFIHWCFTQNSQAQ